jgi:hypothetical protein
MLIGGAILSAVILGAWFPASALYHQHSSLASANVQLNQLHKEDSALAQERKNLSDSTEITRIARQQDQLVSPGQRAFEVLPQSGAASAGAPYAGDPGSNAPVAPSAAAVLPPGAVSGATTVQRATNSHGHSTNHRAATPQGVLQRMLHALEFWR